MNGFAHEPMGINFNELSCYRSDLATLTSVYFKEKLEGKLLKLRIKSSKTSETLKFSYQKATSAKDYSEWLFIFAGIGSNSKSIHMQKITYFLRLSGYGGNILLIPSIFRPEFVKSFSPTGIVGNIPKDVEGLNLAINKAIKTLIQEKKQTISKINYLGFSLGALTAAHLSKKLKRENLQYAPEKVLLLNSPVDLFNSLNRLDKMTEKLPRFGETLEISRSFIKGQLSKTEITNAEEAFCQLETIERDMMKGFIASNLVSMVGNVFYSGQKRTSTGYFESRIGELSAFATREEKRKYWRKAKIEAHRLNFKDYVEYAVVPSSQSAINSSIEQINNKVSMRAIKETIEDFKKDYFLIHSTDDFLLSSREEFNVYANYFLPENSFVVDRGGHLGLLHNRSATDFMVRKLKD